MDRGGAFANPRGSERPYERRGAICQRRLAAASTIGGVRRTHRVSPYPLLRRSARIEPWRQL